MRKRKNKTFLYFSLFFLASVCFTPHFLHSKTIGTKESYEYLYNNVWTQIDPSTSSAPNIRAIALKLKSLYLTNLSAIQNLSDVQLNAFLSGMNNFLKKFPDRSERNPLARFNYGDNIPSWCICGDAPIQHRIFLLFYLVEKIITKFPPAKNKGKNITITSHCSGGAALELLITKALLSLGYKVTLNLIDHAYVPTPISYPQKGESILTFDGITYKPVADFFKKIFEEYPSLFTINFFISQTAYIKNINETKKITDVLLLVDPGQEPYEPDLTEDSTIHGIELKQGEIEAGGKYLYFYLPYPSGIKIFYSNNLTEQELKNAALIRSSLSSTATKRTALDKIKLKFKEKEWKISFCRHNAYVEFPEIQETVTKINREKNGDCPIILELDEGILTDSFVDHTYRKMKFWIEQELTKPFQLIEFNSLESALVLLKNKLLILARQLTEPAR
jgi:hypothetical protein